MRGIYKFLLWVLWLFLAFFVGLFFAVTGPQVWYPAAEFEREFKEKIELSLHEGQKGIDLAPFFSNLPEEYSELCFFMDRDSYDDPDTGERALKRHFQGRRIDLGYEDGRYYSMAVTLASQNDVKIFLIRKHLIYYDDQSVWFKYMIGDQELRHWGCVPRQKAILRLQKVPELSSMYLVLGERE